MALFLRQCALTILIGLAELVDARGIRERGAPRDRAAHRIAADDAMRDAELVEDRDHQAHVVIAAVAAVGRGPGQAEPRHVEADHAPLARERLRPAFPRMERGTAAVQQHDRA